MERSDIRALTLLKFFLEQIVIRKEKKTDDAVANL